MKIHKVVFVILASIAWTGIMVGAPLVFDHGASKRGHPKQRPAASLLEHNSRSATALNARAEVHDSTKMPQK